MTKPKKPPTPVKRRPGGQPMVGPNSPREKMLAVYIKAATTRGIQPSFSEMLKHGYTRNQIRHYYGDMHGLGDAAQKADPKGMAAVMDGDLLSSVRFANIRRDVARHQRFVVTTVVQGAPVHAGFYAAIRNYCRRLNARLLILPAMDPAARSVDRRIFVDPELQAAMKRDELHLVMQDLPLNENLFISSIKLSAKHIDPITSLGRIGQRDGSFIYASPKQRLKMVPTSNTGMPHAVMTTGALTEPDYASDRYMSHRTAYIASHDHVMGAIIVEVEDRQFFHFRQVQADRAGAFIDLAVRYNPDGTTVRVPPEVLVMGDWHSAQNAPEFRRVFVEGKGSVCTALKPRVVIVHDGFDGISINPHEADDALLLAQRSGEHNLDLGQELARYAADLNMMADHFEEVVIVKSNHDEFLHRYLADGRYLHDPLNHATAVRIAGAIAGTKRNPVQVGVEMHGLKRGDSLTWLDVDEDYRVAGIELGAHGHRGPNGARGSLAGMERAYGSSVTGHCHTPEILRQAWSVGCGCHLKQEYNKGPSSWMWTSCLVYPNGSRQLINSIFGHWRLV